MGKLSTLREAIATQLKTVTALSSASILYEQKHDLASEIEQEVGKLGLCIVVLTPTAGVTDPNVPGPMLDPTRVVVAVFENVLINKGVSGSLAASDAAEDVLIALHLWTPSGFPAPLAVPSKGDAIALIADPDLLVYHVTLETAVALTPRTVP